MRKIFIFIFSFFFISFFLTSFSGKANAADCSNRPNAGFNSPTSSTCNPQNTSLYPNCKDLTSSATPANDCHTLNGCYFSTENNAHFCAYKTGAPPVPIYNCANRDPRCPTSTHDCSAWGYGSASCSGSGYCYSFDNAGKMWCAYPKGSPVRPPVPNCIKQDQTGCIGSAGTQATCCSNLICEYASGTYANFIDGVNTIGKCNFVPNTGCSPACTGSTTCSHPTLNSTYTCVPTGECDPSKANSCGNGVYVCLPDADYQKFTCQKGTTQDQFNQINCFGDSCKTALGSISTNPSGFIAWAFGLILSISGGVALLLIIISGYKILSSQGNPEALKGAREQLTAAIVGLLFIIFALVILQIIGVDILHIPAFKP